MLFTFGIAAFVTLGMWQLDRAAQKQRLLDAFAAAQREPPTDLARVRDVADAQHYPHVRAPGHFVRERGYLLDEQMHDGRPGVHAIAVFAAAGEDALLLVDRGWVAWNHAAGSQPALPELPDGDVILSGIYAPYPHGGLRVGGNALPAQTQWPKLTLRVDAAEISADLGKALLPRVLLLDAEPTGGFARDWQPATMPPARHIAYAVQWFTFALLALAIFIGLHWRKAKIA
jgi:cytochrome oxidase assembly protein ShyY1